MITLNVRTPKLKKTVVQVHKEQCLKMNGVLFKSIWEEKKKLICILANLPTKQNPFGNLNDLIKN